MTHPEFAKHGSFAHLKTGRKPSRHDARTLQLTTYLNSSVLANVPPAVDYGAPVPSWPMYGNHRLADCTCAAAGHLIQAWSAAAGSEKIPADHHVEALYWETGDPPAPSGTPGSPTDDGRDELIVLNYWRKNGVASDKITAYVKVDPASLDHVRAALYLFGGVYTMVALPQTAKEHDEWDVVGDGKTGPSKPGSWGGHAVPYVAYDADSFTCVTWGATLKVTAAFHCAYTEEVFAIISSDFFSGPKAATIDLGQLEADLLAVSQKPRPSRREQPPSRA